MLFAEGLVVDNHHSFSYVYLYLCLDILVHSLSVEQDNGLVAFRFGNEFPLVVVLSVFGCNGQVAVQCDNLASVVALIVAGGLVLESGIGNYCYLCGCSLWLLGLLAVASCHGKTESSDCKNHHFLHIDSDFD